MCYGDKDPFKPAQGCMSVPQIRFDVIVHHNDSLSTLSYANSADIAPNPTKQS